MAIRSFHLHWNLNQVCIFTPAKKETNMLKDGRPAYNMTIEGMIVNTTREAHR